MIETEIWSCIKIMRYQKINWDIVNSKIEEKEDWINHLIEKFGRYGQIKVNYFNRIFYFSIMDSKDLVATIRIHRLEVAKLSEKEILNLAEHRFEADNQHNIKIRNEVKQNAILCT